MFTRVMLASCTCVTLVTWMMCYVVYHGYFAAAKVELGQEHYAEVVHPSWKSHLPKWLTMPLNTVVNVGYVIFGAAWCAITSVHLKQKRINITQAVPFYVFNFMSCCYGPIQALRVLAQLRGFAVLDQWYTLPFFMWALVWGLSFHYGWSYAQAVRLMTLSVASYSLVLFYERGFEVALGIHIGLAVVGAIFAWRKHSDSRVKGTFLAATFSCIGFVALKLGDLQLPQMHWIFKHVSGHFLSKICDVFQIHFVNVFFFTITMVSNIDKKKKKE